MPTAAARWIARIAAVLAAVGMADSWWIGEWDLVVLFAALLVLSLAGSAAVGRRRSVPLRADLARWISERARRTGEDPRTILDLAVASRRRALEPDRTGRPTVGDVVA